MRSLEHLPYSTLRCLVLKRCCSSMRRIECRASKIWWMRGMHGCLFRNEMDLVLSYIGEHGWASASRFPFRAPYVRYAGVMRLLLLNWAHRFDWYVVSWGSKSNHRKYMCLKTDWSMSSNNNNHSTLNNEHNWEDLCIQLRNLQTCTFDSHDQSRRGPIFNLVEHIGIKEAQLIISDLFSM
jgi:hypothetical protein